MSAAGKRYSSYTERGDLKAFAVLRETAHEVVPQLTGAERVALQRMEGAVPVDVHWGREISLRSYGLIGYNRSGDNAYPLTPLGEAVVSLLGDAESKREDG